MKLRNIVAGAVMALTVGIGVTQVDAAPIHDAAKKGNWGAVKALLAQGVGVNAKDEYGQTALIWAAANGHTNIVNQLIEAKANVNAKNEDGYTPLLWAINAGSTNMVQQLIKAGADVNAQNTWGNTALIEAVDYGYADIVKQLLAHSDIDISIENNKGNTALDIAEWRSRTHIVKLIEDYKQEQINNYKTPW